MRKQSQKVAACLNKLTTHSWWQVFSWDPDLRNQHTYYHSAYHQKKIFFSWTSHREIFMQIVYTLLTYNPYSINKLFISILAKLSQYYLLQQIQKSTQNSSAYNEKENSGDKPLHVTPRMLCL